MENTARTFKGLIVPGVFSYLELEKSTGSEDAQT